MSSGYYDDPISFDNINLDCEFCGAETNGEVGDVDGSVACKSCMGWDGSEPDPVVKQFLDENTQDETPDKVPVWPPRTATRCSRIAQQILILPSD